VARAAVRTREPWAKGEHRDLAMCVEKTLAALWDPPAKSLCVHLHCSHSFHFLSRFGQKAVLVSRPLSRHHFNYHAYWRARNWNRISALKRTPRFFNIVAPLPCNAMRVFAKTTRRYMCIYIYINKYMYKWLERIAVCAFGFYV
jgi:hypothetical protein